MPEWSGRGKVDFRCAPTIVAVIIRAMRLVAFLAALVLASAVAAAEDAPAPAGAERSRVRAVLDAGMLELWDKRLVRLAQVRGPEAWRGDTAPVEKARAALAALVLNRPVVLRFPGPRYDRHGRLVARVETADGTWVQARLVEQGWARVASDEDHMAGLEELLALEAAARAADRGLWGDWRYRVLDPQSVDTAPEGFHIVEGTVVAVARVGAWTYLNFGEDWRSDFTVSIHRRDRSRMRDGLGDLADLAGRRVRVRGWVRRFNGPLIEATYPQQIEVLK